MYQNNDNNKTDDPITPPTVSLNPNAVWGNGIRTKIVVKEGSELDLYDLSYEIYYYTECVAINTTDNAPNAGHEIVFGKTNRPISTVAYDKLSDYVDLKNEDGFLIYAEGSSLAVAYSSDSSLDDAIEYIKNNLLSKKELVFEENGIVSSGKFDIREAADEARESARKEAFDRIENSLGADIRAELENLFTLYTPRVYEWLAGLYDSDIGGFYFSNSGRDSEGFLPDVESTYQALVHLTNGGMFSDAGGYQNAITPEMKNKILTFVKNLQSSDDGYFYHPQWGVKNDLVRDDYKNARRGRDLGWARSLIRELGGKPYWDTPAGDKGEFGAPGVSPSLLTSRLSASKNIAISKLVANSATGVLPEHLQSMDAWISYIESLNIVNDPYMAGNTLAAQHNEIANAGKDYIDYLTDYLTKTQNPETGFWGEGISYVTMNGFMKLSHSFYYYGRAIPRIEKALDSTIVMLLTPDTEYHDLHICNTYNTWQNFVLILDSAVKAGDTEKVNSLRAKIIEKAPELIGITYDKTLTHKNSDGGFSYFETKPCNHSQMAPVANSTVPEGDINATALSVTGMAHSIFQALGVNSVPIYVSEDADVFFRIIEFND